MKLLITLDFPPHIGGIQKYLYSIVTHQYQESDHVFVSGIGCSFKQYPKVYANLKYFNSILGVINRKLSLLKLIIPYYCLCKQNRGNLSVECGNIYAAFIPWLLLCITRQPYSIYTYGSELLPLFANSFKNKILLSILNKAEHIQTLGKYSEEILRKLNISKPIISNPPRIVLPITKFSSKKRKSDKITILSVGRLVEHKGHENLIRAASMLKNKSNYNIIIVGDGPLYDYLTSLCNTLGLEKIVLIKNNLIDKQLYIEFSKADIFVHPSLATNDGIEGFGIVLLEAMAFNIPIIASNSGGIPEVLSGGSCGLLIRPGNIEDIVQSIQYIEKNKSFSKTLAQKAYKRLITNYVWK